MKRLALSVFGGLVIPFTYTIIAATLSPQINSETLDRLTGYPIRWPLLILRSLGFPGEIDIATVLYIAGCNVLLYTASYLLCSLGYFKAQDDKVRTATQTAALWLTL